MAPRALREADGKSILARHVTAAGSCGQVCTVTKETNFDTLASQHPWLLEQKLVVKPDQLIKRRGKLGLIKVNVGLDDAIAWISEKMGKEIQIEQCSGELNTFIIEPFIPHSQEDEYYVCIYSTKEGDTIYFYEEGGVDVGDVDSKAHKLDIVIGSYPTIEQITNVLLCGVPDIRKRLVAEFVLSLFKTYSDLFFTYLEINPLVVTNNTVYVLDMAAKLDDTADYLCGDKWQVSEFPAPFGRKSWPEEDYIKDLDEKSGASLKLTILNPNGRIWLMVAGGGASVIFSDTVCDLGGADEIANYGEYSGAPSESQTYEYAKTILGLMTRNPNENGKCLIIGGGIANFTNVASTFKGIVRALSDFRQQLINNKVSIYVRRGGPNYQEGLKVMKNCGDMLGVPLHVFGPEIHMTAIVGMALGKTPVPNSEDTGNSLKDNFLFGKHDIHRRTPQPTEPCEKKAKNSDGETKLGSGKQHIAPVQYNLYDKNTTCFVYGLQIKAVQGMLDFDCSCRREKPSVTGIINPFSANHNIRLYFGHKEINVPVYKNMDEAIRKHPDVSVIISFASLRSAYTSTISMLSYSDQIKVIAIIAEGIPENLTKKINKLAVEKGVSIVGPATVGGVKPGCFKIGNTGGMLDNILKSKLYRPGSVAYVSRSGGMSNELNNIVSNNTNGVYEGVAIGGDRYPGTSFMDHIKRYNANPDVKMIVVLGEVGGVEEYDIVSAIKSGEIRKSVVAWCIGTCGDYFSTEVQFGHAGSSANSKLETASAKNLALRQVGAHVPDSFDDLGKTIRKVYVDLVETGEIVPEPEMPPPQVPIDFQWAQELGLVRKQTSFISGICDERGEELLYAGVPMSEVIKENLGVGGVISLLWFQRRMPEFAYKFIELCLIVTADHGPAVSGAHNTIVTARAGKDLVSSLTSGLLTIGDRFGGALDESARQFSNAYDKGKTPLEFVNEMRNSHKYIQGIGHRVKSLNNPDMRVSALADFAIENFPATPLFDYARQVEKITTSKKPNLILNVDGCIATLFVDLLYQSGSFSVEEARDLIEIGCLNALFVAGRSIGFIGHYLDQKRLKQGLYRHPWDDIAYMTPGK
ncbi:hypothetical protein ACHWQZ_G001186 [Mnemiopsis leidyi]